MGGWASAECGADRQEAMSKRIFDMDPNRALYSKREDWRRFLHQDWATSFLGRRSAHPDPHASCQKEIAYLKEVIREKDERIRKLENR